jgi:hypothetical protein
MIKIKELRKNKTIMEECKINNKIVNKFKFKINNRTKKLLLHFNNSNLQTVQKLPLLI